MTDFNPNVWLIRSPHEFRIYGDDLAQTWGVVGEEDYHFLINWKWSWTSPDTAGAKRKRPAEKRYLRRVVETQIAPENHTGQKNWVNPETGWTVRLHKPRIQTTLRMHTVVMLRSGIVPPSPEHTIPDHIDGDERNYRRENLRWATPGMNARNKFGSALIEMDL